MEDSDDGDGVAWWLTFIGYCCMLLAAAALITLTPKTTIAGELSGAAVCMIFLSLVRLFMCWGIMRDYQHEQSEDHRDHDTEHSIFDDKLLDIFVVSLPVVMSACIFLIYAHLVEYVLSVAEQSGETREGNSRGERFRKRSAVVVVAYILWLLVWTYVVEANADSRRVFHDVFGRVNLGVDFAFMIVIAGIYARRFRHRLDVRQTNQALSAQHVRWLVRLSFASASIRAVLNLLTLTGVMHVTATYGNMVWVFLQLVIFELVPCYMGLVIGFCVIAHEGGDRRGGRAINGEDDDETTALVAHGSSSSGGGGGGGSGVGAKGGSTIIGTGVGTSVIMGTHDYGREVYGDRDDAHHHHHHHQGGDDVGSHDDMSLSVGHRRRSVAQNSFAMHASGHAGTSGTVGIQGSPSFHDDHSASSSLRTMPFACGNFATAIGAVQRPGDVLHDDLAAFVGYPSGAVNESSVLVMSHSTTSASFRSVK